MKLTKTGVSARGAAGKKALVEGSREGRLLDALRDLMVERDTLDVTLSEVARRAGVNHALVGYYFGSKEGMFVALLQRHGGASPYRLKALLRTPIGSVEKLRIHIKALLDIYDQCPILGSLLDLILKTGTASAVAQVNATLVTPMVEFYEALVAEGVANGEFIKVDPMFLHLLVITACTAMNTNRARLRAGYGIAQVTPSLQKQFTDYVTDFVVRSIADGTAVATPAPAPQRRVRRSAATKQG